MWVAARSLAVLCAALVVATVACARGRPLPLTDLDAITRITVRSRTADTDHVIRDPRRIRNVVRAVRSLDNGWEKSWHTLPAGSVAALFYHDTTLVGVLWIGPDFVIARGDSVTLIRSTRLDEWAPLAAALELPVKVIPVPPRDS